MTILKNILSVTKEALNLIDFAPYADMAKNLDTPQHWFFLEAGAEHYRLLAYISSLFQSQTLLDIGTYLGDSALALSYNGLNRVISFDVAKQSKNIFVKNIDFRIGNVMDYHGIIMRSPFILLDTFHNGDFEAEFVDNLNKIKYKGLVMFDDLYFNEAMTKFWEDLPNEKYDLTSIGHHSGTGLAVWK